MVLKTEIIHGSYWVEIASLDLRILCGCPADIVKHLKKQGFIKRVDGPNGTSFETGPNVILLSDLPIQNGELSNLSEFPVLQMLYFQGTIIPGHLNNTGIKPLLMGSKEQLDAQMEYIYRGNYGLVSRDEVLATGVSEELANQIMEIKLFFAFGRIKDTHELLDGLVVEDSFKEIRGGAEIRRIDTNVFEISHNGESQTIDLNIYQNERYETPYPLGFNNLGRKYFSIIHSGQGNGWDVNRPSMSSVLMHQGRVYLIDAVPNLQYLLITMGIGINEIEGVFQTHCHDDHFAGLMSLVHADHRIKFYATPLVRSSVSKKLCALLSLDESMFSNTFEVHDLQFDKWNNINGMEVLPILSPHPVENNIFTFRVPFGDGYKSYSHLADLTSFSVLDKMSLDSKGCLDKAWLEKVKENYLVYSDVKKIDVGGGMIHGMASDFITDKSAKLILAHKDTRLSDEEKELGSSCPYGTVDELIPDFQEYTYRSASLFLKSFFGEISSEQLNMLLNNPIVIFSPGDVITKEGDRSEDIYLIITGNAECISTKTDSYYLLSSGAFLPDSILGLSVGASEYTYKALNFLRALKLSKKFYNNFLRKNSSYHKLELFEDEKYNLEKSDFFGKDISMHIMFEIIEKMEKVTLQKDSVMSVSKGRIYILVDGSLTILLDKEEFDTLGIGEAISHADNIRKDVEISLRCDSSALLYTWKETDIMRVPVVYLRIMESVKKLFFLVAGE